MNDIINEARTTPVSFCIRSPSDVNHRYQRQERAKGKRSTAIRGRDIGKHRTQLRSRQCLVVARLHLVLDPLVLTQVGEVHGRHGKETMHQERLRDGHLGNHHSPHALVRFAMRERVRSSRREVAHEKQILGPRQRPGSRLLGQDRHEQREEGKVIWQAELTGAIARGDC